MTIDTDSVDEIHEEQTPVEETTDGPEIEGDEPESEEAPKPKKSAQDRINELTAKQRQAERDAEYWRDMALKGQPPTPAPAPQASDGKPTVDQFDDYDAYVEALTDWKAEQAVSRTISAREKETSMQSRLSAFEQRIAAQFPDGEPEGLIALRRAPTLPEAVQAVILEAESGPKLADYLGSNPRELQRLSSLTPSMQAYELAKLEQQMAAVPRPTNAPQPSPTLRGGNGKFKVDPATSDFAAFEKQYGG